MYKKLYITKEALWLYIDYTCIHFSSQKLPRSKKQTHCPDNEAHFHEEKDRREKRITTDSLIENGITNLLSATRTDPLHRKTLSVSHITEEEGEESNASTESPGRTSPVKKAASDLPVSELAPKSVGEEVVENDFGLSEYIAARRARGHRRVFSAPQTSPSSPLKSSAGLAGSKSDSKAKATRTSAGGGEMVEETEVHSVPYLSPIVLRKELESLITQSKGELLHQESLVTDRPIIYWNLVWLFTRLQLPTYLPLLALRQVTKSHPGLRKVGCGHSIYLYKNIVSFHSHDSLSLSLAAKSADAYKYSMGQDG